MRTRTFGLMVVVGLSAMAIRLPGSGAQEDGAGFVALATASELLELPVPPAVNAGAAPARMPLPPM